MLSEINNKPLGVQFYIIGHVPEFHNDVTRGDSGVYPTVQGYPSVKNIPEANAIFINKLLKRVGCV